MVKSLYVRVGGKERKELHIERIKKDVEGFFEDKCFVYQWEEAVQPWGETIIVRKEEKQQCCCRLCTSPKAAVKKDVLPSEIQYDAILLFSKDNDIAGGSVVEIEQKFGEKRLLFDSVGEMVCYDTHNEIALKRKATT